MRDAVAFILARGGSKRVPRKNVRHFCGKPMVAWPVFHALQSGLFSSVIISTDDQEIVGIAVTVGGEQNFRKWISTRKMTGDGRN